MADQSAATILALYRYPLKGFTPQRLRRVALTPGEALPFDRAWAIENGPGRFDPVQPKHLPKVAFLMLMRDERLATLTAEFDEETTALTLSRDGKRVARGDLSTTVGRQMIEQFVAAYMRDSLRGPPKIVSAPGHSFSDVAAKCVHIVSLASLRELERVAGRPLDPIRFRPNIVIDGVEPWAEFGWIDKTISIGSARLTGFDRTQRCAATNVDPAKAARDIAIPQILERNWGHSDFGIYARIESGGEISESDGITVEA